MTFPEIAKEEDLKAYLDDAHSRLSGRKYVFHYTTLEKCLNIFRSKMWFLSGADCMNDQVEYRCGDATRWKNIFFASFMVDAAESIGMWSVYAQPWQNGVQIAIPVESLKKWVKGIKYIHEISCADFTPTGENMACDTSSCKVFLSSVAYSNCDNPKGEEEKLMWSTARNHLIKGATHISDLTGYIKDMAWDYEKEIRIKATVRKNNGWKKVAIDIPEEILDTFVITAGPLFEGSLWERLEQALKRQYQTGASMFTEKLKISSSCNQCEHKKVHLTQESNA